MPPVRPERVVFMGTPGYAVPALRALAGARYGVVGVYTQPDKEAGRNRVSTPSPVKLLAQELGLPVFQPASLRRPDAVRELRELRPDVIVLAAYGQILRKDVLEIPVKGVVVSHPSLLPRHRGATPIAGAILAGDRKTGVTIMLADEGMDTGPILSQRAWPVELTGDAESLAANLSGISSELLLETLPRWLEGDVQPQPQDDSLATVTRMLRKEDGLIDWGRSSALIWRQVKAYQPWPGAFTYMGGEVLHICGAWPLLQDAGESPGMVVPLASRHKETIPGLAGRDAFGVQTGEGLLAVFRVQKAGKSVLWAGEFMRGQRRLMGSFLGQRAATLGGA